MIIRLSSVIALCVVTTASITGCAHNCGSATAPCAGAGAGSSSYRAYQTTVGYPPPTVGYAPGAPIRLQPLPAYQYGPVPVGPGAEFYPQYPQYPQRLDANYPNSPAPPAAPPAGSAWQPGQQPNVQLAPPSNGGSADISGPAPVAPAGATQSSNQGSLPAIPQFAEVKSGKMATGLKPHPIDGLSWLQARGYRAVLCVRAPGEEDSADRRLAEKHGMKYLTLEVSAETLTRQTAEQFNQIVSDPDNQPVFVYDRDGAMAGALWYLHFRMVDNLAAEAARTQAARLGLRDDQSPEGAATWSAVQRIVVTSRK